MRGRPQSNEAAPYYFTYIDRIPSDDISRVLETQLEEILPVLRSISEDKSLHRYAPDKWSIRQVQNHVNDTERTFLFRALWFARGFDTPLPSFDQNTAVAVACADEYSWARHLEEFESIRAATLAFFRNLPADGWMRTGIASGNPFTVRALAYIIAGHAAHHTAILQERYVV
ncbi:MAG TPA: DinB family protein [Acidobacteriota bacterium]|nr:DinB family protein [Acidobacteriota bacterium]